MKRLLVALGILSLTVVGVYAAVQSSIERYLQTGSTTEAYNLDGSGNVRVAGWQVIGGSSTIVGAQTVTGNQTVSGNQTVTGSLTHTGLTRYVSVNNGALVAGLEILPTSSYMTFQATGAAVTMQPALPEISTATTVGGSTAMPDGTFLILSSTGTNTVQFWDNGTVAGSRLRLAATNRLVGTQKTLTLIYNALANMWIEVSYANN